MDSEPRVFPVWSHKNVVNPYGKPVAFYSDKHTILRVNKADPNHGTGMTQFGRALQELNIDIIRANSSQAKAVRNGNPPEK